MSKKIICLTYFPFPIKNTCNLLIHSQFIFTFDLYVNHETHFLKIRNRNFLWLKTCVIINHEAQFRLNEMRGNFMLIPNFTHPMFRSSLFCGLLSYKTTLIYIYKGLKNSQRCQNCQICDAKFLSFPPPDSNSYCCDIYGNTACTKSSALDHSASQAI